MTTIGQTIKQSRIQKQLTQADVAQRLGIARSSLVAVEKGDRDISFEEAEKLSSILGVSVEALHERMVPNAEKYKQMILQFLRCLGSTDKKIPKTKLAKYLYLADFAWFYEHMESMSGMSYRRITYGPVASEYFLAIEELERDGLLTIDHKQKDKWDMYLISKTRAGEKQELDKLSKEEIALLKKIEAKWRHASTQEIVGFTHNQKPYLYAFDGELISYAVIGQENPNDVI